MKVSASSSLEVGLKDQVQALDVSDLKAEIEKLQREWSERLADTRRGIEVSFQQALTAKLEQYGSLRIAGFGILVVGLVLSTWANLLD